MRGSQPQVGELVATIREANLGKIAMGDQSMRSSQPQVGELVSATREANLGKIAMGDQSMRGSDTCRCGPSHLGRTIHSRRGQTGENRVHAHLFGRQQSGFPR